MYLWGELNVYSMVLKTRESVTVCGEVQLTRVLCEEVKMKKKTLPWTLSLQEVSLPHCGLLLERYFLIPRTMCFPGGSVVKSLPAMQETRVQSPGGEDPLEESTTTHSSILAWRISWTEEPGRLQSIGSQRVKHDSSDWAYTHQERWNFGNDPLLKGWFLELPLQFARGSSSASSFNVYKSQFPPL